MHIIRGLIVDDREGQANLVSSRLSRYLERLGCQVHWTTQLDAEAAIQLVANEEPFDIVVADLLFPRHDTTNGHEPAGLDLIGEARRRSDRTFIFAISVGDFEHRADLLAEARRAGANRVAQRGQFSPSLKEHSPAAIADAILTHLVNNGTITNVDVTSDEKDAAVQAVLHEVGATTITQLCRMMLDPDEQLSKVHVGYLAPGASGAAVCTVHTPMDSDEPLRHVLKLSRNGDALRDEAKKCALAARRIPFRYLLTPQPAEPVGEVNGWYALGSQLQTGARTLRAWLADGPAAAAVTDVLDSLFIDALGPMSSATHETDCRVFDCYPFPAYRQARVLDQLALLRGALTRADGGGLADTSELAADISAFVTESRMPNLSRRSVPGHTHVGYAHGDLHSGNILVYERRHPAPIVIDLSRFGPGQHWAADPAEFVVDLLISCVDGGAESMFFAHFPWWREIAAAIGRRTEVEPLAGTDPLTAATVTALNWLTTNLWRLRAIIETDNGWRRHGWEWHVALAAYFLRAACRRGVVPPKRAFAIVAAHDQLLAAAMES